MQIRAYQASDHDRVIELWRACDLVRPVNNPSCDIARKLQVRPELFIVGIVDAQVVASVMAGYEGHRGWINYLAVHPQYQRRGLGRRIMEAAEGLLKEAGCPKINLQVRTSNAAVIAFYKSLGYAVDDVISMGKRLQHDPA